MKPYWEGDGVTLWHGDCELFMANRISEFADPTIAQVVITSPPYNMGLTPGGNGRGMYRPGGNNKGGRFRDGYDDYEDAMPQDEYDDWQRRVLGLLWAVIPDDGAIYYNHKQRVEHGVARLPLGLDFGIPLRQIITWDRGTGIGVNLRHYSSTSEFIFLFAKPNFQLVNHSASGAGDVWRLGMAQEKHRHPAPFPESLPTRIIATTGPRSVFDPFAGSGTVLRVARDMGVPAVGVEKSSTYCEASVRRLDQGVLDFGDAS